MVEQQKRRRLDVRHGDQGCSPLGVDVDSGMQYRLNVYSPKQWNLLLVRSRSGCALINEDLAQTTKQARAHPERQFLFHLLHDIGTFGLSLPISTLGNSNNGSQNSPSGDHCLIHVICTHVTAGKAVKVIGAAELNFSMNQETLLVRIGIMTTQDASKKGRRSLCRHLKT
jgi:hypothetical protein